MYEPRAVVLYSDVSVIGQKSFRESLASNGTYFRCDRGERRGRQTRKTPRIFFQSTVNGDRVRGHISDPVIVERILRYWSDYFGAHYTNCSAFAHYLTTGKFLASEPDRRLLVIEQGMRPYEIVGRVDVGDMLCLLYANKKMLLSRKYDFRKRFREVQKLHSDNGGFAGAEGMKLLPRPFSPEEIRRIYETPLLNDYHFMVCVAKHEGKPVWLSQCGRMEPGAKPVAFAVTVGEFNPYCGDIPAFALIKKRR